MQSLTLTRSLVSRAFYLTVFEILSTFLWFSMFPVSKISDWAKSHCDGEYSLNIFQYYFLGIVGVVNAATIVGLTYLLVILHFPPYLAAILGAIAYPIMSGGIHLDGLSDTTDALFSYSGDKFKVLTDPHTGALGAIHTTLFTLAQVAIYATLLYLWMTTGVPAYLPILLSAAVSRVGSFYILVRYYPDFHPDHMEHLFPAYHSQESLEFGYNAYCCFLPVATAILLFIFPISVVPLCVATLSTILVAKVILPKLISNIGIIYGDLLGMCILLSELLACFLMVPYYG